MTEQQHFRSVRNKKVLNLLKSTLVFSWPVFGGPPSFACVDHTSHCYCRPAFNWLPVSENTEHWLLMDIHWSLLCVMFINIMMNSMTLDFPFWSCVTGENMSRTCHSVGVKTKLTAWVSVLKENVLYQNICTWNV